MPTKKSDHIIIRNSDLFCSNCGRSQKVPYPIEIPVFLAMSKAFSKSHLNCEKTWAPPVVDAVMSEGGRVAWWMANGEHGLSSKAMFQAISGIDISAGIDHPLDPADFRRCYLLLRCVPEWKGHLSVMRNLSPAWANLVDNWDKLTLMLEEQTHGMYEFMQSLI